MAADPECDAVTADADYDVLIIGAGVGGLVAAVLLARAGRRVLVAERLERVGGRASTVTIDGFRVNTGAAFWELGGAVERTCRLAGVPFAVRPVRRRAVVWRVGRRELNVGPVFGSQAQRLLLSLGARAARRGLRDREATVAEWLVWLGARGVVRRTVRNLCGSVFAAAPEELRLEVFLSYFANESAFAAIGICPGGTVGVPLALADGARRLGAEIWTGSEVRALHVEEGCVRGATVVGAAGALDVSARAVISDAGPAETAALCPAGSLDRSYLELTERLSPCALLAANFAARQPLTGRPFGGMLFGDTERLVGMVAFTPTCPEYHPEGWHQYVAWSMPPRAREPFDPDEEKELLFAELSREFPRFSGARVLSTEVFTGSWPAQRALAGFDLPRATPIANLWNVGDGVKEFPTAGTEACARTAELTAAEVLTATASRRGAATAA